MGRGIVKIKDKYVIWSTVVDAPITEGMSRDELVAYVKETEGLNGVPVLGERIKRTDETGTSFHGETSAEFFKYNRAGDDEETLNEDQLHEKYCREK